MSTTSGTHTNTTSTTATSTTTIKVNPEQAVAFAALILADDNLAITPERLQTLLEAAGIAEVEPVWTTLFANALKDKHVKDILTAVATSSPGAGSDAVPCACHGDEYRNNEAEADGIDIGMEFDSDSSVVCGLFD